MGHQFDQAYVDCRADPTRLGFSASLPHLGYRVVPLRLGRRLGPNHLGHRAPFQIYHELKT